MYIIPKPGTKVKFYNMYKKRCSRAERKSCELEERVRYGAGTSQPALRGKLDLRWRAQLQSKLQDLNMQIQGSQKLPNKCSGES